MHGVFIRGVLVGVDFTQAGEFTNESGDIIKFGDSVKLEISVSQKIVKQDISTQQTNQYMLHIPVENSVKDDVEHYNKLLGKTFEAAVTLQNGLKFRTQKPTMISIPFDSKKG